jgi:hypothetical protein
VVKRTALPFEEQQSFNSALFLEGVDIDQLESLFTDLLGYDYRRAVMVPMIASQLGVSSQPAKGGRVVTLLNPVNGYDVAIDVF